MISLNFQAFVLLPIWFFDEISVCVLQVCRKSSSARACRLQVALVAPGFAPWPPGDHQTTAHPLQPQHNIIYSVLSYIAMYYTGDHQTTAPSLEMQVAQHILAGFDTDAVQFGICTTEQLIYITLLHCSIPFLFKTVLHPIPIFTIPPSGNPLVLCMPNIDLV